MSLRIYKLFTTVNHSSAIVDMKKIDRVVFSFFNSNIGSEDIIKGKKLEFVAQEGYNLRNINTTDYLESNTGGLIFSKRFVNKLGDTLKNELNFYPCNVFCQGEKFEFYIAQVKFFCSVINKESSIYRELTDGRKVISTAIYKNNFNDDFYIAKDIDTQVHTVVSEKFVELCKLNGMQIDFREAKTI